MMRFTLGQDPDTNEYVVGDTQTMTLILRGPASELQSIELLVRSANDRLSTASYRIDSDHPVAEEGVTMSENKPPQLGVDRIVMTQGFLEFPVDVKTNITVCCRECDSENSGKRIDLVQQGWRSFVSERQSKWAWFDFSALCPQCVSES